MRYKLAVSSVVLFLLTGCSEEIAPPGTVCMFSHGEDVDDEYLIHLFGRSEFNVRVECTRDVTRDVAVNKARRYLQRKGIVVNNYIETVYSLSYDEPNTKWLFGFRSP